MRSMLIPDFEIRDFIREYGETDAANCYQCGMCTALCPWFQVEGVNFLVHRLAQAIRLGDMLNTEDKDEITRQVTEVYRCVGCDACRDRCPRGVSIADMLRAVRRILVENESVPSSLRSTISQLISVGNPLGGDPQKRTDWAGKPGVPTYTPDLEYAWFTCCTSDYDPRGQDVNRATAAVLKAAGVSFGILGCGQSCCGEAIRKAGAESAFKRLADDNTGLLAESGAKKLLVTSPHCYNGFKNDYPELETTFEVIHISQLLAALIRDGRLKPAKPLGKKVTYHDPCTLGRQNGIYEEPREILRSIPGLELVEIEEFNRDQGVCCGGGGGGLWLDWPKGERLADVRIRQAADTGAEILAVACPYCLSMFEDSVKTSGIEMQVLDVVELLAQSLG